MMKKDRLSPGQVFAIDKLLSGFTKSNIEKMFILSTYFCRDIQNLYALTRNDWRQLRDSAFPDWINDNWEVSCDFKGRISDIRRSFDKSRGQMFLF